MEDKYQCPRRCLSVTTLVGRHPNAIGRSWLVEDAWLHGFDKEFVRWDLLVLPIHFGQGKSAKKLPYQDNKQSVSERTALSQGESESAPFTPKYPMNCSFRQGPSYTIVGLIKRESGIDKEHTVFVSRRLQSGTYKSETRNKWHKHFDFALEMSES